MNLLAKPWWREEPLTPPEMRLLQAVAEAHAESALRQNVSSQVIQQAAAGSQSFTSALVAALATLGGLHAPIRETYELLDDGASAVRASALAAALLAQGRKVPGWGNSFHRGRPDPVWHEVDRTLREVAPDIHQGILSVTATLHRAGKPIFPNPSAYTAATAIVIGLPAACAPYLFIAARLDNWSALIAEHLTLKP